MTKYTRRSFVKRSGSVTLGAALGLGLIPSLTRKLHAADSSGTPTGNGVKGYFVGNAPLHQSSPSPLPQYGGGTINFELLHEVTGGNCSALVTSKITRRVTYTLWVNYAFGYTVPYIATMSIVRTRSYECRHGSIYVHPEVTTWEPKDSMSVPISSGSSSIGTLTLNADGSASVFLNSQGVDSDPFLPPSFTEMQFSAACC